MAFVVVRIEKDIRIRKSALSQDVLDALKNKFIFDNPEYQLMRVLKIRGWWNIPEDVGTWGEDDEDLIIPRGGLRGVREVLEEYEVRFKYKDLRTQGGVVEKFPKYRGHPPRYYQEEAIAAIIKNENCVIRLPTGSGKSLLAIALASRIGLNTLVILPTVGLFDQWCQDALESLSIRPEDLGIIHRKKRILRPITVAVQGTLAREGAIDEEMDNFFGVVIVDECQKSAAASYMRVVESFSAKYRIGISADERRKDKKEFLTNGLFGRVVYEKKRKELENEGFINNVEIRVVPTNFDAPWYGLSRSKDDDLELDFPQLLAEMTSDEERNKLAVKFALEEAEAGEQVILLSHRVEHCHDLDRPFVNKGIRTGFFIGGPTNRKEFEMTRAGILEGRIQVGIGTYGALGVGVNLPAVAVGVATTPIAGNRFNTNQVRGRLNRKIKGKGISRLYVLWDHKVYPKHLQNLVTWNPTVKVYSSGRWIEGKQYLKRSKKKVSDDDEVSE